MTRLSPDIEERIKDKMAQMLDTGLYPDDSSMCEGFRLAIEMAIDRVKYCRFSIVLKNDDYTKGAIEMAKTIEERIRALAEPKSSTPPEDQL